MTNFQTATNNTGAYALTGWVLTGTALMERLLIGTALAGLCMLLAVSPAHALPAGGQVTAGTAVITAVPLANTLNITQTTSRAIIDWQNFNIGANEHVNFIQPSSQAIALNRVTGSQNPTQILGSLTANGHVWIINPNGVIFGQGAQINVAGLIVSSANISNTNFMNGNYQFDIPGNPNATISNAGHIVATEAGLTALVGPNVSNTGIIQATVGKVQLGSAETFTVDLYGDGLINLQASPELQKSLSNSGTITSTNNNILISTAAAQQVVNNLINTSGIVEASNATTNADGSITLSAGSSDTTVATNTTVGTTANTDITVAVDAPVTSTNTVTVSDTTVAAPDPVTADATITQQAATPVITDTTISASITASDNSLTVSSNDAVNVPATGESAVAVTSPDVSAVDVTVTQQASTADTSNTTVAINQPVTGNAAITLDSNPATAPVVTDTALAINAPAANTSTVSANMETPVINAEVAIPEQAPSATAETTIAVNQPDTNATLTVNDTTAVTAPITTPISADATLAVNAPVTAALSDNNIVIEPVASTNGTVAITEPATANAAITLSNDTQQASVVINTDNTIDTAQPITITTTAPVNNTTPTNVEVTLDASDAQQAGITADVNNSAEPVQQASVAINTGDTITLGNTTAAPVTVASTLPQTTASISSDNTVVAVSTIDATQQPSITINADTTVTSSDNNITVQVGANNSPADATITLSNNGTGASATIDTNAGIVTEQAVANNTITINDANTISTPVVTTGNDAQVLIAANIPVAADSTITANDNNIVVVPAADPIAIDTTVPVNSNTGINAEVILDPASAVQQVSVTTGGDNILAATIPASDTTIAINDNTILPQSSSVTTSADNLSITAEPVIADTIATSDTWQAAIIIGSITISNNIAANDNSIATLPVTISEGVALQTSVVDADSSSAIPASQLVANDESVQVAINESGLNTNGNVNTNNDGIAQAINSDNFSGATDTAAGNGNVPALTGQSAESTNLSGQNALFFNDHALTKANNMLSSDKKESDNGVEVTDAPHRPSNLACSEGTSSQEEEHDPDNLTAAASQDDKNKAKHKTRRSCGTKG